MASQLALASWSAPDLWRFFLWHYFCQRAWNNRSRRNPNIARREGEHDKDWNPLKRYHGNRRQIPKGTHEQVGRGDHSHSEVDFDKSFEPNELPSRIFSEGRRAGPLLLSVTLDRNVAIKKRPPVREAASHFHRLLRIKSSQSDRIGIRRHLNAARKENRETIFRARCRVRHV